MNPSKDLTKEAPEPTEDQGKDNAGTSSEFDWVAEIERLRAANRCTYCGRRLASSIDDGCVDGNCSYRPLDGTPEGAVAYWGLQMRWEKIEAALRKAQEGQ